jgi:hypothetical protein
MPAENNPASLSEILDQEPNAITRPLSLIDGHAYAVSWPPLASGKKGQIVLRDDGALFTDEQVAGVLPLSQLGLPVQIGEAPLGSLNLGGAAIKRYAQGGRPNVAEVFECARSVIDYFLDFARSLAEQRTMTEFTACWAMATYFLDAFTVVGYLWPNGERGSGKSHFLQVVAGFSYLGQVVLAGGSYASLRDLAHYGATLAFDDSENVADGKFDPDKRQIMLAGNMRGTTVTMKEPVGPREFRTRHVHAYCPRLFSAIKLPDPVLGSRTITVPLVRSNDPLKTKRSPSDISSWPVDRDRLKDDLWLVGLANLPLMPEYFRRSAELAKLLGRDLQPWRGVLAVALFLEECHAVTGLFSRMEGLSRAYQSERVEFESSDRVRLLILAAAGMLEDADGDAATGGLLITTGRLTERINCLASVEEVEPPDGRPFASPKLVGWDLKRLRFERAERTSQARRWRIDRPFIQSLARAHGVALGWTPENDTNDTNVTNDTRPSDTSHPDDVSDVPDVYDVLPGGLQPQLDNATCSCERCEEHHGLDVSKWPFETAGSGLVSVVSEVPLSARQGGTRRAERPCSAFIGSPVDRCDRCGWEKPFHSIPTLSGGTGPGTVERL